MLGSALLPVARACIFAAGASLLAGFGPCPAGTEPAGAEPPAGLHRFCKKAVAGPLRFVAHGPWQTWYTSGQPYERGAFVDGHRDGDWEVLDPEGVPLERGHWSDGKRVGTWILWERSLIHTGPYPGGVRASLWSEWQRPWLRRMALHASVAPGQEPLPGYVCRTAQGEYRDGLKTGPWTSWDPCGARQSVTMFDRGQSHGVRVEFWPSGAKKEERPYIRDQIEGVEVAWHANGQRAAETTWVHGHRDGAYRSWRADGSLAVRGQWRQDQPSGIWTTWHPNGHKACEGERAGWQWQSIEQWDADGNPITAPPPEL